MKWLLVTMWTISLWSTLFAFNILVISPADGHGEQIPLKPYIEQLLDRQHQIIHVTSKTLRETIKSRNYSEVLFEGMKFEYGDADEVESFQFQSYSTFFPMFEINTWTKEPAQLAMRQANISNFIHDNDDLQFHLMIYQDCSQESWLMFAHKYNIPIVVIATTVTQDYWENRMGLMGPHAIVSHGLLPYSDKMSVWERFWNIFYTLTDDYLREKYHLGYQNAIAQIHFRGLKKPGKLPWLEDIMRDNVSFVLTYSHRAIFYPRPALPNMINIGGAHLRKPKKLPDLIQNFLDGAVDGAIYISFGTVLKPEQMPLDKLNMFLEAFKNIRQRVLWKFNGTINLPNVMTQKWVPQNDVLAHPNVVLFISQGGTFSNYEAVANGVQMLLIPFNHNHYRNAMRAEAAGYAEYILYRTLTLDQLISKLRRMLIINDSYSKKAKDLAIIMNDNVVSPMAEAMYWIEYACELRWTTHLRTHARHQDWFQYLVIDVFLVSLLFLVNILIILYICCMACCCKRRNHQYQYTGSNPNDPNKKTQ